MQSFSRSRETSVSGNCDHHCDNIIQGEGQRPCECNKVTTSPIYGCTVATKISGLRTQLWSRKSVLILAHKTLSTHRWKLRWITTWKGGKCIWNSIEQSSICWRNVEKVAARCWENEAEESHSNNDTCDGESGVASGISGEDEEDARPERSQRLVHLPHHCRRRIAIPPHPVASQCHRLRHHPRRDPGQSCHQPVLDHNYYVVCWLTDYCSRSVILGDITCRQLFPAALSCWWSDARRYKSGLLS